jgi:hypothetical protein
VPTAFGGRYTGSACSSKKSLTMDAEIGSPSEAIRMHYVDFDAP